MTSRRSGPMSTKKELVERGNRAVAAPGLHEAIVGRAKLRSARGVHRRRLEQDERMHDVWCVCGELESDGGAVGDSDDVRAGDAERVQ